jgi:hypothetical protein
VPRIWRRRASALLQVFAEGLPLVLEVAKGGLDLLQSGEEPVPVLTAGLRQSSVKDGPSPCLRRCRSIWKTSVIQVLGRAIDGWRQGVDVGGLGLLEHWAKGLRRALLAGHGCPY